MTLTPLEKLAIELVDLIATRREKYDAVNADLKALGGGDFDRLSVQFLDEDVENGMVRLIDQVLSLNDIANYYLYECVGKYGHGGGITCCPASEKKPFKLRNVADLERYVRHAKKCQGRERSAA